MDCSLRRSVPAAALLCMVKRLKPSTARAKRGRSACATHARAEQQLAVPSTLLAKRRSTAPHMQTAQNAGLSRHWQPRMTWMRQQGEGERPVQLLAYRGVPIAFAAALLS